MEINAVAFQCIFQRNIHIKKWVINKLFPGLNSKMETDWRCPSFHLFPSHIIWPFNVTQSIIASVYAIILVLDCYAHWSKACTICRKCSSCLIPNYILVWSIKTTTTTSSSMIFSQCIPTGMLNSWASSWYPNEIFHHSMDSRCCCFLHFFSCSLNLWSSNRCVNGQFWRDPGDHNWFKKKKKVP